MPAKHKSDSKNLEKELTQAIKSGSLSDVNRLIDAKADVNYCNDEGLCLLMVAVNKPPIVRALLDAKADATLHLKPEGELLKGIGPLNHAVFMGQLPAIKMLLGAKALITEKTPGGGSLLLTSAKSYSCPAFITKYLIDSGINVNDGDTFNTTPLMAAAGKNQIEKTQLLLEAKANLYAKNEQGDTALIYAAYAINLRDDIVETAVLNQLIAKLSQNPSTLPEALNAKNKQGRTALMVAAANGTLSAVKLLQNAKADLTLTDNEGYTAIKLAQKYSQPDIATYLQKIRASSHKTKQHAAPESSRLTAGQRRKSEKKEVKNQAPLSSSAASPTEPDAAGTPSQDSSHLPLITRFKSAINSGKFSEITPLLAQNGDNNLIDELGNNLIIIAILANQPKIAIQLLAAGIPADQTNNKGQTPLFWAASKGHLSLVNKLLKARASVDPQDFTGWSPLMKATKNEHLEVIKSLLKFNASPDKPNKSGRTAMTLAQSSIIKECLQNAKLSDETQSEATHEETSAAAQTASSAISTTAPPRELKQKTPQPLVVSPPDLSGSWEEPKRHRRRIRGTYASLADFRTSGALASTSITQASPPAKKPPLPPPGLTRAPAATQPPKSWPAAPKPIFPSSASLDPLTTAVAPSPKVSHSSSSYSGSSSAAKESYELLNGGTERDMKGLPPARSSMTSPLFTEVQAEETTFDFAEISPLDDLIASLKQKKFDYVCAKLDQESSLLNSCDKEGNSLLMIAIKLADPVSVRLIISYHPNTNHINSAGETPLLLAVKTGLPPIVGIMLSYGVKRNVPDNEGFTALMRAVQSGRPNVVREFLKLGKFKTVPGINDQNPAGDTPLLLAVKGGNLQIVEDLLRAGANPSLLNHASMSAAGLAQSNEEMRPLFNIFKAPRSLQPPRPSALTAQQGYYVPPLLPHFYYPPQHPVYNVPLVNLYNPATRQFYYPNASFFNKVREVTARTDMDSSFPTLSPTRSESHE